MTASVFPLTLNARQMLGRFRTLAGLDFHIMVTLLFRGWSVIAGGITVILLPLLLSPTEQGYYFTFASVLALQVFFELGLNQIVMQLVSHEVAHLTKSTDGKLTGDPSHLGRLSSLARLLQHWYVVVAVLFALVCGCAGAVFFSLTGTTPISVWIGPWMVLVCATAVNLWLSPGLAVMEGCGQVGQVARLRMVQSMMGYICLWAALLTGAGLWVAIAVPVISAACTFYWLKYSGNMMRWLAHRVQDTQHKMHWRTDIFPLQWRIALSWASGYLIFSLFTPVVFARHGAVAAGQLGMALAVFSAISTIGMSWVNANAPQFTMLIARKERHQLNRLFRAVFIRSTTAIALIAISFTCMAWYLTTHHVQWILRLAPPPVLAVLTIVTIINSMIFAMVIYMRAHREEPMLTQSIVIGLMIALMIYFCGTTSVLMMMSGYMMITLFIGLPWTVWLFLKYKTRSI